MNSGKQIYLSGNIYEIYLIKTSIWILPVMRWCSKFEKNWFYSKHQYRTADPGSFREDFEATLNEDPYDLYCGFEEIPAQQTAPAGEVFVEEA